MIKLEKHRDVLFSTLLEINSLNIGGMDKETIFRKLIDCCLIALEAERVYLIEMDEDRLRRYWKSKGPGASRDMVTETIADSPALLNWISREVDAKSPGTGGVLAIDLPHLAAEYLGSAPDDRVILSAPLVAKKSFFGLIVAIHEDPESRYSREDEQLLTVLANHAAIALENRQLYSQLEREAITDGLTGVYNYRFLISTLESEIKRARRFGHTFSFVMLDVDNLKEFNDRKGHLSGSQALKEIAALLRASCRDIDFVSKYGGDEFGVILPQTDLVGAEVVTRRVLGAVRRHTFEANRPGLLTCSAGVSIFPHDGDTVRQIIASADKALYKAKHEGKNRVLTTRDLAADAVS